MLEGPIHANVLSMEPIHTHANVLSMEPIHANVLSMEPIHANVLSIYGGREMCMLVSHMHNNLYI